MCIRRSNRLKHSFQTFPEARVRYPQSSLSTLEIYDKQFRSQYEISNKRNLVPLKYDKQFRSQNEIQQKNDTRLKCHWPRNALPFIPMVSWTLCGPRTCLGMMPFMMVSIKGILFNVSISITIFQYVCRKQLTHVLRGYIVFNVIID